MVNTIKTIRESLRGKKTYIVGFLAIALGVYAGNEVLIFLGLTSMTIKAGMSREIARVLSNLK